MKRILTYLFILFIYINNANKGFAQVTTTDSLALVDFYNSTNGATAWTNKTGWLSGPVSGWFGIGISGNNVASISLSGNNLTGSIPASLGNLPLLSYLDLSSNHLNGNIPYSFGNTNLNTVYLYNNQLSGSIPGTLGNLALLSDLELNNNNLTGVIPDSLQTLFNLNYLDLSTNQLTGNVPAYLGTLPGLNYIYLYSNQLSGNIPTSLATSTSLQYLNLNGNQLSGSIPALLGNSTLLRGINLSHNQLSDTIPSALGNPNLFFLDISHNQLTGTIPASFANITSNISPTSTAVNNNKLTFDGLEYIVQSADFNPGLLSDSQQAIIPLHLNGSVLSTYAGGTLTQDTFYWYKNGIAFTTIIGDSTFVPTSTGNYSVIVSNSIVSHITGLKLYSDTFSDVILPVTFLNFTGQLQHNTTLLQWQTITEINTAYFNLQRSTDAINFTTICTVNAIDNNSPVQNYQYIDNLSIFTEYPKNLFYRLQEVDKDGQSVFSKIVTVSPGSPLSSLSIYPNPATNILNIDLPDNKSRILLNIIDANGRKQLEETLTGGHLSINISDLPAGVYFIQLIINGTSFQQKFIKQ